MTDLEVFADWIVGEASTGKLVFFLGAGASFEAPASLPLARPLQRAIVSQLASSVGSTPDIVAGLASAVDACVPESVYDRLSEVLGDTSLLTLLNEILGSGDPNEVHRTLAGLAKAGCVQSFVTTNFDRLLERALAADGVPFEVVLPGHHKRTTATSGIDVVKIHGSLERPDTIVTTLRRVGRGLDQASGLALRQLLSTHCFVFVGWSDADFDLSPMLLRGARPFVWIEHAPHRPSFERRLRTGRPATAVGTNVDSLMDKHGGWIVRGRTLPLLRIICRALGTPVTPRARPSADEETLSWEPRVQQWSNSLERDRRWLAVAAVQLLVGQLPQAAHSYRKGADAASTRSLSHHGIALDGLGQVYVRQGKWKSALSRFDESKKKFSESGEPDRAAKVKANAGVVLIRQRRWDEAYVTFRGLLKWSRKRGFDWETAALFHNLGIVARSRGKVHTARRLFRAAAALRRLCGDLEGLAETWNSLAIGYRTDGQPRVALRYLSRAKSTLVHIGKRESVAYVNGERARLLRQMDRVDAAITCASQGIELAKAVGNPWLESALWREMARCRERAGDSSEAIIAYQAAQSLSVLAKDAAGVDRARAGLARLRSQATLSESGRRDSEAHRA